ncbi:GNAT family N-acetyltransferase [Ammoniphilus resinae]|uniref:Ribosomal protein S18 acetylase RimI-like enzyme n=1 Tax=Ammoniphilus resinae TaxID=861532 RepID=A0ABS4GTU0_9BACL|nr:GNAT family N-acetyltransferase [Ammoniphilus resinae]MBP1933693.1 ribosomal protein S18 acetylase RimI-like enzyme [Ammoniphilus resinae]
MLLSFRPFQEKEMADTVRLIQEEIMIYKRRKVSPKKIEEKLQQNETFTIYKIDKKKSKKAQRIGVLSFRETPQGIYLDLIALEKAAQHKGFGRLIFRRLEKEARTRQAAAIYLHVLKENLPAQQAYQKYGLDIVKSKSTYLMMSKTLSS